MTSRHVPSVDAGVESAKSSTAGYHSMSATQAIAAMRDGKMSSQEYVSALLARARALHQLNAFISLDDNKVLQAAINADKARSAGALGGALAGLPIAIKDSVNTSEYFTSNGTQALKSFQPAVDAPLASKLFNEGAICFGKTNMTELSFGWTSHNGAFGAVHNPHDPAKIPGGSSGGSAAAVAAGMVPIAVAADTLGSLRIPAAMCGIYGFRPTHGRYPGDGIFSLTDGKFDQAGALTRSVADLALFDSVQTGSAPATALTSLSGIRLGIAPYYHSDLDPEIQNATEEAYRKLQEAGAVLVKVDLPSDMQSAFDVAATIMMYEALPSVSSFLRQQQTGVSFEQLLSQVAPDMQDFLKHTALPPNRPPEEIFLAMVAQRVKVREATTRYFQDHGLDAMVYPPISALPAPIGENSDAIICGKKVSFFQAYGRNTALGPVANLASLVVPITLSKEGLPIALEFSALPHQDPQLLALGFALERTIGAISAPLLASK
ncbi:amidase family protein [Ottowia thiooxydans]|uniref:Asp-tRNA(Asn)/Glu-tRNA(Gln) amidotransferase A subunit family amidase n=1 Tax=Ottowia thiooxydans TaxID=219182 RepID=A0ABV2QCG6_9BURK